MKKILFPMLALTTLVINNVQPMDKPQKENSGIFRKTKNIAINTLSEITDSTFNFIYKHPFITACLVGPFIPNKFTPFRRFALAQLNKVEKKIDNVSIPFDGKIFIAPALASLASGVTIRANLLHMFSHQYLNEKNIEHKDDASDSIFLLSKCTCSPKVKRAK